jgi:thiosulfate reductase cytochrome b subunit
MKRLVEKHPLAVRWFHWINFPLLFLMIWSGLMIYWASSDEYYSGGVYRLGWGDYTLFHFFPAAFWEKLGWHHRLAEAMGWHFFFMWLFAINGILYVLYLLISGEWRTLVPGHHALRGAIQVALHDLHLSKKLPPFERYNPAQQIAYTIVILMGGASLLTGLAIYRPVQVGWLTSLLGGYQMARWEHFWLMMGFIAFFVIHIIQVARAGWGNFRSMVAGCDLEEVKEPTHDNA